MTRLSCLFLILTVPLPLTADETKLAWRGPDQPVYVVTQNHYAEGFTPNGGTARFGDLIAIEVFAPGPHPAGEVYKVGEYLSLFVAARRTGKVKIEKVMPLQCDSSAAILSADSSVPRSEEFMALATNAKTVRPHENNQRQPTAEERKYAAQLASSEFQKRGVPAKLANGTTPDQLIVTRLDGSVTDFLIGSFSVKTNAVHEVFLIARMIASAATAEFVRYHKTADVEDGTDSEGVRLVGQLDLDGDGTDEIVVEVTGYESEEFAIYKRRNRRWNLVHVGGQGGC